MADEEGPVEPGARRSRPRGWVGAVVLAVVFLVAYRTQYELLPFVFAAAVGFVLDPAIRWLQPYAGGRRWVPAVVLFLLLLLAGAGLIYWIGGLIAADLAHLAQTGPQAVHGLAEKMLGPNGVSIFGQTVTADTVSTEAGKALAALAGAGLIMRVAEVGIGTILGVFLTLVLSIYMMLSGPRIAAGVIWLFPPAQRRWTRAVLPRVVPALRRYLIGVAGVVSVTAVAAYIGFGLLFHLPHAIVLSATVALLETIPAIGPATSLALVGMVSLQRHGMEAAALLMGYAVFLRLAIDNGLGPLILGKSARLHPVSVIFAFVCGAALFGVMGLLLAVPTGIAVIIVLDAYYAEPVAEEGEGEGAARPATARS